MMDEGTPAETIREHPHHFAQFNQKDSLAAQLESIKKVLPDRKKGVQISPDEMEQRVRRMGEQLSPGMGPGASPFLAIGEGVIRDVKEADGDVWAASLRAWGLADLKCLGDIRGEDHTKAAGFLEAARHAADDIAAELGVREAQVLELVDDLRPYEAPGYSIEMAVSRARIAHNMEPTASDQVDEEHVAFAPYVDLMFVDKRTRGYVESERRRDDGRMVDGAEASITSARNLQDTLEQIRLGR